MKEYALNVLWITALLLPVVVFLAGPKLSLNRSTFIRALLAIGCGWIFWIAYTIAAQTITSGMVMNGASYSFSIMFGWFLPTIDVTLTWAVYWYFLLRQHVGKSNQASKNADGSAAA